MDMYDTIESNIVYKGRIVDVSLDKITLPDGRTAMRECVLHGGASAILPVDKDGGIIFVRQYRHPAKELVLEIPAGTLEKGEDPLECAKRELEEETGWRSENIQLLFKMYSAIGFCTEILYIYLAKDLTPGRQNLDADEFVTIETYSADDAVKMVYAGEIKDSKTIAALFAYKNMLNNA